MYPAWSEAVAEPLYVMSSAPHSVSAAHVARRHGVARTCWSPAFNSTDRFSELKGPEPTLYLRVIALVLRVSHPSEVREVYGVRAKPSRPIALKVAASRKEPSPAYSVRIRVGDSTWKRASPDLTVENR